MSETLPVIAAIPNYNMADSLRELLPQLLQQGYDAIYVLDDASTDHSQAVVAQFSPAVTWVPNPQNGGAGAARNKILDVHKDECIIHFLDADIRLLTDNIPAKARKAVANTNTAFVGGLVLEANGKQNLWNYGPGPITLYASLTAAVQTLFGNIQAPKPLWRNLVRILTKRARAEWPDPAVAPSKRAVYWLIEGNLIVRRSVFEKLGGFDTTVREHDIMPPAQKAFELGLVSYFDPSIAVKHLAIKVRNYNRNMRLYREQLVLIKRSGGWRQWLLPGGRFKPRYNQ